MPTKRCTADRVVNKIRTCIKSCFCFGISLK